MAFVRVARNEILDTLTWLRGEVYGPLPTEPPRGSLVPHPLDDDGIASWLADAYIRYRQTMGHEAAKHRVFADISNVVHPPPPPPPPTPVVRGPLALTDRGYTLEGQLALPVLCHFGEGFSLYTRARDAALFALDDIAQAGYRGLRTWITLNLANRPDSYWGGRAVSPEITPGYWDRLEAFVGTCSQRGLLVHLAPGGLEDYHDIQETALFEGLRDLIAHTGLEPYALIEGLNEARDTGDRDDADPAEIARLVNIIRYRHPALLYALSAYTGTEDRTDLHAWTPGWMSHYYVHGYRGGHYWDKIRHIFSLAYETPLRRFGWQGEPCGPGPWVSSTEHQDELDNEALALMGAMSLMARQVWCYMSSPGVIYDRPFTAMPGFVAVPRLAAQLPADLMSHQTLCHGGDRWRGTRVLVAQGDVRCDHAVADDGRFVAVVYGPAGEYRIDVERPFTGQVLHPGTGQVEGDISAGSGPIRLAFTRGRMLLGQAR